MKDPTFQTLLVDFLTTELDLLSTLVTSAVSAEPVARKELVAKLWKAVQRVRSLEEDIVLEKEREVIHQRTNEIIRLIDKIA